MIVCMLLNKCGFLSLFSRPKMQQPDAESYCPEMLDGFAMCLLYQSSLIVVNALFVLQVPLLTG